VKRLPVDSLLAIIGKEGEDISALLAKPAEATQPDTAKPSEAVAVPETTRVIFSSDFFTKGVVVITMPRLSDTMTEGTVATWLKK
jgi:pyruvate dehydrogenase E2 component (dihydrolipoamide acetyltransferase)